MDRGVQDGDGLFEVLVEKQRRPGPDQRFRTFDPYQVPPGVRGFDGTAAGPPARKAHVRSWCVGGRATTERGDPPVHGGTRR